MLIVTTSHSVLVVDPPTGEQTVLHRGMGLYFGACFDSNGRLYVGARNRMMSSATERDAELGRVIVFDSRLRHRSDLFADFAMRDIHGMAYFDDQLWVCCSRDNFIAVFDGRQWTKWYPLPGDDQAELDIRHYNTVVAEGRDLRVVAHNHGDSELHIFDRATRQLKQTLQLGALAHNTWVERGAYYTCSSKDGTIVSTDGRRVEVGGFPRGYARTEDRRYVGINEYVPRHARDDTSSRILVFDDDWTQTGELLLEDEGMILEIVPIPRRSLRRRATAFVSRTLRPGIHN